MIARLFLFMETFLLANEGTWRWYGLFAGSLFLLLEAVYPARLLLESFWARWFRNLGLFVTNLVLIRLVLPVSAVGLALLAAQQDWGLLNLIDAPFWLTLVLGVLALDATLYALHRALHRYAWLWRIHAVHHSDKDFDCTTGLRFHPLEVLLSMLLRMSAITALGIPVSAVIVFEIWGILVAFYTHVNFALPHRLDTTLRRLLVTPNMHLIHHSTRIEDGNSNFGIIFSLWDHLFRSYRAQSAAGVQAMQVGLSWFNRHASFGVLRLLALPLLAAPFKD